LRWLDVSGELRENREWRPLLAVETEMNGDSKSTNERCPSLVGSMCLSCPYTGTRDFCSALATLVGRVQNIFFLAVQYFSFFVRIAQQAGQTAVLGHPSLSMCL
jgi:hypothetical protein